MKIQVCFQVKDKEHNDEVVRKLMGLKEKISENDKIISCHLPIHILNEKGWSQDMTNALNTIFEGQYECLVDAKTFDEAMKNMNEYRKEAAMQAEKIYVIGEQSIANISLEIELFTNKAIQFI